MNSSRAVRVLVALLMPAAVALAQGADTVHASSGVWVCDGQVGAGGPDYSARFDERGAEFTPALGEAAERPLPVRFTLDSVRRGAGDVFVRTVDVAPTVEGQRVRYAHRSDLTEVYDVRADGIEQSFVFATKPAGTGDLVVRGAITTELPLADATDDGVRYEREGLGGVTFGAVTGVDANGATARGSMRAGGDHVEWVLPAAFVDHCAYPLVLDPLIGAAFAIGNIAGGDDVTPNIAFDDSTGRYLVVWNVSTAAASNEIRAQFVSAGGALVGGGFLVGNGRLTRQAVANINGTHRFLVAYSTSSTSAIGGIVSTSVRVVAINASNGALSNAATIEATSSFAGTVGDAVVGGDSRPVNTAQTALVVYHSDTIGFGGDEVRSRIVHVPATGDPIVTGAFPNALAGGGGARVTTHGGPSLRWLLTWTNALTLGGPPVLMAGVVGSTGALCGTEIVVCTAAVGDSVGQAVSASPDGSTFLIAWYNSNGGADDVQAMLATWSGSCGGGILTPGPVLALPAAVGLQDRPAVAFAKDKFVLAWRNRASVGATSRVFVKGLDPTTCASCGAEWSVDSTVLGLEDPAIASRYSAGDTTSDEVLVVWSNTSIRGRRFEAVGNDTVVSMGGGCGSSGFDNFATYNGDAVLGNLDFELALANPTLPVLALVIGLSNVSLPCGPCTLVPALDILAAGVTPNPLPIPCDLSYLGVDFYAQWLLYAPGGCPILPDFALSNALKFTIGE